MAAARQTCAASIFGTRPRTDRTTASASASALHSGVVRRSACLSARLPAPLACCPRSLASRACSLRPVARRLAAASSSLAACRPPDVQGPTLDLLQLSAMIWPLSFNSFSLSLSVRRHGDAPHAHHHSHWRRAYCCSAARSAPGPRQPDPFPIPCRSATRTRSTSSALTSQRRSIRNRERTLTFTSLW